MSDDSSQKQSRGPMQMTKPVKTDVFFVVDGERLEAQAILLAATLKRHLTPNQTAIAYVREDHADRLAPLTRAVLDRTGVEIRVIPDTDGGTHQPWSSPYPQGNKILAAAEPREATVSVFLDTDTVLIQPVDFAAQLGDALVAASASDYSATANDDGSWGAFYGLFGLPLPDERITLRGGRQIESLPYYNAGVVIFRERMGTKPTGFGKGWLADAVHFDHHATPGHDRATIDQFTLPITATRQGRHVAGLDQAMNYNIQASGDETDDPLWIAHYHNIGVLWAHGPTARHVVECLLDVISDDELAEYIDRFFIHIKRSRLKHVLRDVQAVRAGQAAE